MLYYVYIIPPCMLLDTWSVFSSLLYKHHYWKCT